MKVHELKSLQVDVLGGSMYLFILCFIYVTMRLALTKASVLCAIRYGTPIPYRFLAISDHAFQYQDAAGFQHFGIKHFAFVGSDHHWHFVSVVLPNLFHFCECFGFVLVLSACCIRVIEQL